MGFGHSLSCDINRLEHLRSIYILLINEVQGVMEQNGFKVAVVGATGAVGNLMVKILEERAFPVSRLRLLASARSIGKTLGFRGSEIAVEELVEDSFEGIQLALFSAGGSISKKFAPIAARAGAVVIDNSNAWRMDPNVPLVVPEVNPEAALSHSGIIANPNCSTIQMVVALKPIYDAVGIRRIVVTTFQAVSGTGKKAIEELRAQVLDIMHGREAVRDISASDRLQLLSAYRPFSGKRLQRRRDEDGERDPENVRGCQNQDLCDHRSDSGYLWPFRIDKHRNRKAYFSRRSAQAARGRSGGQSDRRPSQRRLSGTCVRYGHRRYVCWQNSQRSIG